MNKAVPRVMFLCTGNSARSIFAEYLLKNLGKDRFEVYSAGAQPTGHINPLTLRVLQEDFHIDAKDARSKSVDAVKHVPFDLVVTVCDNARQTCPVFPGGPTTIHWNIPDPAAVEGTEADKLNAFRSSAREIRRRVERLCALREEKFSTLTEQK